MQFNWGCQRGSSHHTEGTALTANLKTSCPFMKMLSKDPLADACVSCRGFIPSPQYIACSHGPICKLRHEHNIITLANEVPPIKLPSDNTKAMSARIAFHGCMQLKVRRDGQRDTSLP